MIGSPISGLELYIYHSVMKKIVGQVVSVHAGSNEDLGKEEHARIQVELDGVVGRTNERPGQGTSSLKVLPGAMNANGRPFRSRN